MTQALQAELHVHQVATKAAYVRFMTAADLLRRRGLSVRETGKVEDIHLHAFGVLTMSLARIQQIHDILYPDASLEQMRQKAPRYSSDARRAHQPN